jgi:hypothetical protein
LLQIHSVERHGQPGQGSSLYESADAGSDHARDPRPPDCSFSACPANARAWLPDPMLFPAVDPDAPGEAEDEALDDRLAEDPLVDAA